MASETSKIMPGKPVIEMTDRQVESLYRLLAKFAVAKGVEGDQRVTNIIWEVRKWVKWYGQDEINYEVKSR